MKNKVISVGLLVLVIGNSVVIHASENVLATVQEIECPVCLEKKTRKEYSLLPIFQCRGQDGEPFRHFVCSKCIETSDGMREGRISVCPECKAPRISLLTPEQQPLQARVATLLETLNGVSADLRGADLICANLRNAILIGANLIDALLHEADLRGANLTNADLRGANLIIADLTNANLMGVNLTNAGLVGADLTNANLMGVNLTNVSLIGAHLHGANLTQANLTGTNLSKVADLEGARFIRTRGLSPENRAYAIAHGAIVED